MELGPANPTGLCVAQPAEADLSHTLKSHAARVDLDSDEGLERRFS